MTLFDNFNPILRDIKHNLGILFEKGYKIRFVNFKGRGMLVWNVIFESHQCLIHIYKERSEIYLTFAPLSAINMNNEIEIKSQFAIQTMAYYLTKGKVFVGLSDEFFYRNRKKQFQVFAGLLKEYLDKIEPYFANYEFQLHKSDLLVAQQEYNDLLLKRYVGNT